jgi:hypothetical protein
MNTPAAQQATDEGPLEQAAPATGAAFRQQSMRRNHSLEQPSLRSSHQNILAPNMVDQLSLRPASAPLPPSADAATGSSTHRRAGRSKAARQVGDPLLRTEWQKQDEARKERNRQTAAASRCVLRQLPPIFPGHRAFLGTSCMFAAYKLGGRVPAWLLEPAGSGGWIARPHWSSVWLSWS